ncbi:unnamed protein product, partial [Hymenolepis diminuta]
HCVSSSGLLSSIGKVQCASDGSYRDIAESAILGISPPHTVPSFSYNRPAQLKHTYNYVLMRILVQVTIINRLPTRTHTHGETVACQANLPSLPPFPQFSLPFGSQHYGLFNTSWSNRFLVFCFIAASSYFNRNIIIQGSKTYPFA